MPKKTKSQSIGEVGVAAAAKAFVKAGWSVDAVHSDYGEDLIAQTFLDGEADSFRILVQVKSSRSPKAITISRDHARKWLGSVDMFLMVLWDVSIDAGFYFVPSEKWSLGDLFGEEKFVIRASDWQPLLPESISRIEWESRLRGWNLLLLDNKSKSHNIDIDADQDELNKIVASLNKTNIYVVFKLLSCLDFVEIRPGGAFIKSQNVLFLMLEIRYHFSSLSGSDDLIRLGLDFEQSILLAILWKLALIAPGAGIPGSLLEEAVRATKNDMGADRSDT